ncbi:hypothetical protein MKQ68_10935 [Chitinophaga horti]|uniref:DUF4374 domain-containing protein n=1 Tax=Chitinophaga horti TaxID=2920382 RepID=A0ABY6J7G6_9BACT|nr:hypothetical protein [Chitinophaga horti]UYQ95616.1 hypothetical protein MKQ68_10935 [Chitinophaga horti]
MKTTVRFYTGAICLSVATLFSACDKNDGGDKGPDLIKYFVGVEVDGSDYMVPTADIMSGTISAVGKGVEGVAYHAVVKDGFLYAINGDEATLEKYEITETGITKVGAISTAAVMSGSFARYTDLTETNDLLLMNFPNDAGSAPYAIIDIATFKVESYGTFKMPDVDGYKPTWCRATVSGNKAYVGAEYTNPDLFGDIPDSLITIVYDYPSFTNPKTIVSKASAGSVAGYRTKGSFKDEKGDIYQWNLRSNQWTSNVEDVPNTPCVFVKIKNGDYDNSYAFNVSEKFTTPVSIWNAWYAGNGIVYANVIAESDLGDWAQLKENVGQLHKIDIYNKTVTKLNIPKARFVDIFSLSAADNGKFYIPVSVKGGAANIYEITNNGGADAVKAGAKLDGANAVAPSLNILK